MPVNILLLSYKYPPYEGVGARRWAKFSKSLANKGVKVHVITRKWPVVIGRSWTRDVEKNENIIIKRLWSPFDLKSRNNILGKIAFKLERIIGKVVGWTDESYSFYQFNIGRIIRYINQQHIEVVIATGGPFSSNYFGALIKQKLPQIKLIQDFRDLWSEEYFFENPDQDRNNKIYLKELVMEKLSLQTADYIVSVTPGYLSRLERKALEYKINGKNYVLIENGFDSDERLSFNNSDFPDDFFSKAQFNISHFGTVGFGREAEFYKFITKLKEKMDLNSPTICFHFFGFFDPAIRNKMVTEGLGNLFKFYEFMPPAAIQKFMFFSDMHLVLNDKIFYFSYGSKIYDALMYQKPVLLISKEEGLYWLIKNNSLGLVTNNSEEQNTLLIDHLLDILKTKDKSIRFNGQYDFNKHSVNELAEKFITLI